MSYRYTLNQFYFWILKIKIVLIKIDLYINYKYINNTFIIVKMENLNKRNIKITEDDIHKIYKDININKKINNINIYQQSFTHKSYVKDNNYSLFDNLIGLKEDIVDFKKNVTRD